MLALKEVWDVNDFIETGTFQGDTTFWAAQHFERVTTIELPGPWYDSAKEKLRSLPHVMLCCGDSRRLLAEVAKSLHWPSIFWLDAHWMGSGPKSDQGECGLLEEIAAVNASPFPHIILCDDARYFENPPPPPHNPKEWPTMWQVTEALDNGARRYVIVEEDVIVAVPMAMREWLAGYLSK